MEDILNIIATPRYLYLFVSCFEEYIIQNFVCMYLLQRSLACSSSSKRKEERMGVIVVNFQVKMQQNCTKCLTCWNQWRHARDSSQ